MKLDEYSIAMLLRAHECADQSECLEHQAANMIEQLGSEVCELMGHCKDADCPVCAKVIRRAEADGAMAHLPH